MKKLFITFLCLALLVATYFVVQKAKGSGVNNTTRITVLNSRLSIPAFNGYSYSRAITIANASSTQSSFPVLVCFNGSSPCNASVTELKIVANGGKVQSTTGLDIIFTSDSSGLNLLPYEQEAYASTTGESEYWVNVSSVTNGTVFYMFYGNASARDRSNPTGVWDSNYKLISHLPNGTTLSALSSTGINNGTITNATATSTGQIDGAGNFNGSNAYIDNGNNASLSLNRSFTLSAWINPTATVAATGYSILSHGDSNWYLRLNGSNLDFLRSNTIDIKIGSATIPKNAWTYVAVTIDGGGTATIQLYTNGVVDGSSATYGGTFNTGSFNASIATAFQGGGGSAQEFFSGAIDEVRISNTNRSGTWIVSEYNNQSSPSTFYTLGSENVNSGGRLIIPGN